MITRYDIVYYIIYLICLYASFKASSRFIAGLYLLRLLLCCGFINEMVVEVFQHFKIEENTPHYFYIPLEYILLVLFYKKNTRKSWLKKAMEGSIFFYTALGFSLAIFYYHFQDYPSLVYNVSCLLNTIWIVILLYDIETLENLSITSLPLFWILTALLIFYSGIFFSNGAYNYLLQKDSKLAQLLRQYNIVLNYVLYLLLTYGFFRSWIIAKYSYQS